MKKIVLKDNFAFIYLNKNIYSKESILEAIEIYKEFFKSSITQLGDYTTVKIEPIDTEYEIQVLANEFSNYILSLERGVKNYGL